LQRQDGLGITLLVYGIARPETFPWKPEPEKPEKPKKNRKAEKNGKPKSRKSSGRAR
jgi:hypothetical protein